MDGEKISVTCGWGEGIDVLLTNKGQWYIIYDEPTEKDRFSHGVSKNGSIGLTRQDARELAYNLLRAAEQCDAFDESYDDYMKNFEKIEKECV